VELFPSLKGGKKLPSSEGFSQVQNVNLVEAIIDTTTMQYHCWLQRLKS
jgi:hypothetical protein